MDKSDLHKIDDVKKKLNSPYQKIEKNKRVSLRNKAYLVKNSWNKKGENGEKEPKLLTDFKPKKKFPILAIVAILAFIFFVGAVFYAISAVSGNQSFISGENIDIDVIAPVASPGGDIFNLDIAIINKNQGDLEFADLVIEYPQGTKDAKNITQDLPRVRQNIGTIESGKLIRQSFQSILFGEENQSYPIEVRLEYQTAGSNAIFKKSNFIEVTLGTAPVLLTLDTIKETTSGQTIEFDVEVKSNTNEDLKDLLIEVDYPFGFTFLDSNEDSFSGDRVWKIDELGPEGVYKLNIKGELSGQNNEERFFVFSVGLPNEESSRPEVAVAFDSISHGIEITRPFLAIESTLDKDSSDTYVGEEAQFIDGKFIITNTTSDVVKNLELIVSFDGDVLDRSSVTAEGAFFRSSNQRLIWDSKSHPDELTEISPGEDLEFHYTFKSLPFVTSAGVFADPKISITLEASGDRDTSENVPETILATDLKTILYTSRIEMIASSLHQTGALVNSGPIPPVPNQKTTYTVEFTLLNSSNQITTPTITANVPPYVDFVGKFAPSSESVTYDSVTREIKWVADTLDPEDGYIGPAKTVSVQLELVPSENQIKKELNLLENIKFIGYDSFAQINRTIAVDPPTTRTADIQQLINAAVLDPNDPRNNTNN